MAVKNESTSSGTIVRAVQGDNVNQMRTNMTIVTSQDNPTIALDQSSTRPAISGTAARLSFAAGATAIGLLAALHILSPEFDPSWRMVSEYALGGYAWVLVLMMFAWASSSFALFFAVRSQVRTLGGRIGLVFLLAAAAGAGMGAIFNIRHDLHGLAFLIGVPSLPIAAMLISLSLVRNQAWSPMRRLLLLTANLTWMSVVLLFAALFIGLSQSGGQFGPHVLIGWPNRLLVVIQIGWVMVAAWQAARLSR